MDINDISNEIDLKLNLLSGEPLFINNIGIKPYTLREINKIGFSNYMKHIGILTLDKNALIGDEKSLEDYSLFEIIVSSKDNTIINTFLDTLSIFLHEDKDNAIVNQIGFIFNAKSMNIKEAKIVDNSTFDNIIKIVKYQNCLTKEAEAIQDIVAADDKAREIAEKLKKSKKMVEEIKAKENKSNNSEIDFYDIVSSVSTKSNTYNKNNVWDLTIYQLYDEYKRLEAISSFEINMMAIVQGAKIDDWKHWSSKIE